MNEMLGLRRQGNAVKKIILLLVLILFSANTFSLSIQAPEKIIAGTQWTLTIEYPALTKEQELKVFLDNELLFVLFEHNSKTYIDEHSTSPKIISLTKTDSSATATIAGIEKSQKTVFAGIYFGDEMLSHESKQTEFFVPLGEEEKKAFEEKISSLEKELLEQKNISSKLENDLNSKTTELSKLSSEKSLLEEKISGMETQMATLEETNNTENPLTGTKNNAVPITGFFSTNQTNSLWIAFISVIAITIISFALYYYQNKKGTIY
jgi:hypothetical protein